jgi:outer membrane protein OmpA-like peptidoglycan-associated protein
VQSEVQDENRRVTIIFQEKKPIIVEVAPDQKLKDKLKDSKVGDLIRLPNLYFFNNSAKIVPKSQPVLYDLLCLMNDNPKLKIEIQGHICCKLPNQVDAVSTARARAIYNFLIANKVSRKRLSFKGFGATRPIHPIPEKSTQEEDDNRRVEIMIVEN